jgi:hypothetical protein
MSQCRTCSYLNLKISTVFREQEFSGFGHELFAGSYENIRGFRARVRHILTVNPPPYEVLRVTGFKILTADKEAIPTFCGLRSAILEPAHIANSVIATAEVSHPILIAQMVP